MHRLDGLIILAGGHPVTRHAEGLPKSIKPLP